MVKIAKSLLLAVVVGWAVGLGMVGAFAAYAGPGPGGPGNPAPAKKPPVSFLTQPTEPGVYAHPGKRFVIRFPAAWRVLRVIDNSQPGYYFTPEDGQVDPHHLKVAFSLALLPVPESSALQGQDPVGVLKHFLPVVRMVEPGLSVGGAVSPAKLGGLDAATVALAGTLKDRAGEFAFEGLAAEDEGVVFVVGTQAPKAEQAKWEPAFQKIIRESQFGRPRLPRRETALEARRIVEKYKGSIVSVWAQTGADAGTGSGFIISKDGYLITNWHVIWNDKANKPHEVFHAEWDEGLRRKQVPAQLVGYRRRLSVFDLNWGVDIAMLKIPAGDYVPLPLTPMDQVEPGDSVVTLGFPSRALLEGVSLTVTSGDVTRFNRGPDGKVETLYISAPFTHGSSGGPCVSLVTGGVIGLNTFSVDIRLDPNLAKYNDLVNYKGVVPIDYCLTEFPLVTQLDTRPDGSQLDFFDCYAISGLFTMQRSTRDAQRLAARAVALNPQSADAHYQLATCKYLTAIATPGEQSPDVVQKNIQDVLQEFQAALACDPTYENALVMLAFIHERLGRADEATQFARRAIEANPASWQTHHVFAQVALAQGRYPEALTHADKAKELASGIMPEPHILAGKIRYAARALDAGKADYAEACRIQPADLAARLGVAQYYELKSDIEHAVAEYQAILEDFKASPIVFNCIGDCYYKAAQYDKALPWLLQSEARFAKLQLIPPESLYLEVGKIDIDRKNEDLAINWYTACLWRYPKSEMADGIHIYVAGLHAAKQRMGLTTAHLALAKALKDSPQVNQAMQRYPATRLSLAEIKKLIEINYPYAVAQDVIANSSLDFAAQSDADLARLEKDEHLPPAYMKAILISAKREADAKAGVARPPANPVIPTPAVPQPINPVAPTPVNPPPANPPFPVPPPANPPAIDALVGAWTARGRTNEGVAWQYTLQILPGGRYTSTITANGQVTETVQGSYRADGQTLTGRSDAGRTFAYAYRLQGNILMVNMPDQGGTYQFVRQ